MLFHSPAFLLGFLPLALIGHHVAAASGRRGAGQAWLLLCSLAFYALWSWKALPILMVSTAANFALARRLARTGSLATLAFGVAGNVALLAWFKLTPTVLGGGGAGAGPDLSPLALPLGLSFLTFQQIAYLVDARRGEAARDRLGGYALFVSFFPHLVAGPILYRDETMPELERAAAGGRGAEPVAANLAAGITVLAIGLWKKVMIADTLAATVDPGFAAALGGDPLHLFEAWFVAVAYALQIYFDFSGYSDMASGIALLFGIRLPLNFDSPYKARNIADYWSRWHMTLTRFLRSYLYNPLALALMRHRSRAGGLPLGRRPPVAAFLLLLAMPTLLTMLVAGIWHGAGAQFAIFGLLHGGYLVGHHAWQRYGPRRPPPLPAGLRRGAATVATFAAVVVALVFFRCESVDQALTFTSWMLGSSGAPVPEGVAGMLGPAAPLVRDLVGFAELEVAGRHEVALVVVLLVTVWGLPNTRQWLEAGGVTIATGSAGGEGEQWRGPDWLRWRPSAGLGAAIGCAFAIALLSSLGAAPAAFLYARY